MRWCLLQGNSKKKFDRVQLVEFGHFLIVDISPASIRYSLDGGTATNRVKKLKGYKDGLTTL